MTVPTAKLISTAFTTIQTATTSANVFLILVDNVANVSVGKLVVDATIGQSRASSDLVTDFDPTYPLWEQAGNIVFADITQVRPVTSIGTTVTKIAGANTAPATTGSIFLYANNAVSHVQLLNAGQGYLTNSYFEISDYSSINPLIAYGNLQIAPLVVAANAVGIYSPGDTIEFHSLTSESGLWASATAQAAFLRAEQAYIPDVDPRLPKHVFTTNTLTNWANAEIQVSDITVFPAPSVITANSTVTANTAISNGLVIQVSSTVGIRVGNGVVTANITPSANTVVAQILANGAIKVSPVRSNVTIAAGELIHFTPFPTVGSVRIAGEVIYYDKVWAANSTLTDLTRTVENTVSATILGNIGPGNLISALGLRTVSS